MSELAAETFGSPLTTAATLTRFVAYVATLLAAGGMLFIAAVHDRRASERARMLNLVTAAAAAAAVATLAGVAIQAALLTGRGVAGATDVSVLAAVAASPFGTSAIVRVVTLVVLSLAARAVWRGAAVAVALGAAVGASGSFLLSGHTVEAQPGWLAVGSALAHTLAAAAWFGGLVLLAFTLRHRRADAEPAATAAVVARFSTMATLAVIVVSVAGLARVTTLMPVDSTALGSAYGVTLIAKVLLVGIVFGVAGYNHRYLVPAVRATGDGGQRRLQTTVRLEGLTLVVVIAASAVLANLSPPGL